MRTAWATDTDRNHDRGCQTAKGQMIGNSVQLQTMIRQAGIVAPTDSSVLLLGETGTGKGCLAEMIHNMSGRRDRPFRARRIRLFGFVNLCSSRACEQNAAKEIAAAGESS